MPLTPIASELQRAQADGYAVPLFDVADSLSAEGVCLALEERAAPGIVALWTGQLDRPNAAALAAYIKARAKGMSAPVSLMLDHGASVDQCKAAIAIGFTDVMYDGSRLPLEENMANTQAVVREAHACGVAVEAELGHVGSGGEYQTFGARREGFTDPAAVERFVEETNVDFLAVAIGTAHGVYDGDPMLDLELLRQIRARTDVPLVLHGASGCSDEQLRSAIAAGICKINVATDLFRTASARLREAAAGDRASYFSMAQATTEAFRERAGYYSDLFNGEGTGDRGRERRTTVKQDRQDRAG